MFYSSASYNKVKRKKSSKENSKLAKKSNKLSSVQRISQQYATDAIADSYEDIECY